MSSSLELAFLHADACSFSAAMAKSEQVAIKRLRLGQDVFEQASRKFGGRVVNTVGDSILIAFGSAEAAFVAAQDAVDFTHHAASAQGGEKAFDYRMGITQGRVTARGQNLYGHSINMAARIGSLVGRNSIGVERQAWRQLGSLASGTVTRERKIFAKPDEPFVDFVEISGNRDAAMEAPVREGFRNEPLIVLCPQFRQAAERQHRYHNEALEAFVWNCSSFFSTYGWQTAILDSPELQEQVDLTRVDYVVRCRTTKLPMGLRLFASLVSTHANRGAQNFTRDAEDSDALAANTTTLASLVGSAIAHDELERAAIARNVGSHQLVAAGRACIAEFSATQFATGMRFLQAAQLIDPEYPLLLSSLARAHAVAWRFGFAHQGADLLATSLDLAKKASRLAPGDARCEADLGFVKFWANEPAESAWHYERSIDTLPYHPELSADAGMVYSYVGQKDQAATVLERSIANLPIDADYRLWSLGDVYFAKHDYRSSLKWLSRMSDQSQAQRLMAANKALLGLDASSHVANVLALQPDFSVRHWVNIQPFTDEQDRIEFEEALLLAGLPP